MDYIRQAAAGVASWFYAAPAADVRPAGEGKTEASIHVFSSFASRTALQRSLIDNYDVALGARNLRNDKERVRAHLAAAADKVGVEAVRQAIVERLGDKGVRQAIAHQQLDRVVRSVPSVIVA